jgi:hypothetical protein
MAPIVSRLLAEHTRWESLPDRCEPLTKDMLLFLNTYYGEHVKNNPASLTAALIDWFTIGIHMGLRLSEWAQPHKADLMTRYQRDRAGDPKAFTNADLEYYDSRHSRLSLAQALLHPSTVASMDVRFRFQKNEENGQKITLTRLRQDPVLCPVRAFLRLVDRARKLNIPSSSPLSVFTLDGQHSRSVYLIHDKHITTHLRFAARHVYNITAKDDLARFSPHSIRVGACVALHAANIDPTHIKFALRWKSDTFRTYLRNRPCQAARIQSAISTFNPDTF